MLVELLRELSLKVESPPNMFYCHAENMWKPKECFNVFVCMTVKGRKIIVESSYEEKEMKEYYGKTPIPRAICNECLQDFKNFRYQHIK